jgi:hypothetical protein
MANPFAGTSPPPLYFGGKFLVFIGIREGIRPISMISGGLKSKYLE